MPTTRSAHRCETRLYPQLVEDMRNALCMLARCPQHIEDKRNALRAFSRCTQHVESVANAHSALKVFISSQSEFVFGS